MHDIDRTQFEADEFESGFGGEFEQTELELPLHETQELELASALLGVSNEMELEEFLGEPLTAGPLLDDLRPGSPPARRPRPRGTAG